MVNFELNWVYKMPRNKRRCKTGATVKFAQPTDEGSVKSSYESKLREWRKVRDSLETEGTPCTNKQKALFHRHNTRFRII